MYVRPVSINGPTAHLANRLVARLPYPAGGRCVLMGRLLGPPGGGAGRAQKSYSRPGLGRELFFGLQVIKAGRIDCYKVPKIGIMYFFVCLSFTIQKNGA